jgi:hydroxysqualene synthase
VAHLRHLIAFRAKPLGKLLNEKRLDHYENFPVASWLCPPRLRPPIAAIYRFARLADDVADEGAEAAQWRLDQLSDLRLRLVAASQALPSEGPMVGVFGPLAAAIKEFELPVCLLSDLLDAFQQDVIYTRDQTYYPDHDALLAYCAKSANPIGRLLLHLYGIQSPSLLRQSDHVCSALQLINFWQDLSVDLPRGRHYLPTEALHKQGLNRKDVSVGKDSEASRAMIRDLAAHAQALMMEGKSLAQVIPGRAGWELRMVVQGGLRILEKIQMTGYSALSERPTLKKADIATMLWRSFRM